MSKDKGMSMEEMEDMSNFAGYLFDQLDVEGLSPRELFILGFLRGREFTLEQLGVFDDDDDGDLGEPPEIIKKYIEYEGK